MAPCNEDEEWLQQQIEETLDYMTFACNPETTVSGSVGLSYIPHFLDGFFTSFPIWERLFVCTIY